MICAASGGGMEILMQKIRYLTSRLDSSQKKRLGGFFVLCLLAPAADIFSVSMILPIFQQAFSGEVSAALIFRIVLLSLVLLAAGGLELFRSRVSVSLSADIAQSWSVKMYELYGMEEAERHNRKTAMQAVNGARNDPATCASMLITFIDLTVDTLTLAAYFAVLVYVSPAVGFLSCILIAAIILILYRGKKIHMAQYGEKKRSLEIRTSGMVSTTFGSYKEVKIDSRRENLVQRYRAVSADCAHVQKEYAFMLGVQGIVLQNVMQAGLFLILAVLLAVGVDFSSVLPEAMLYLTLLLRMIPSSKKIITSLTGIQYGTRYFEAFREDMERYEVLKKAEAERQHIRYKPVTLQKGIRVRDVCFQYPNGKVIFDRLSVDIPAGHSIAVIGPSGEGKTTFLDLILGLLQPQDGHIWYDDFDIVGQTDEAGACWADIGRVVSYIPQTVYLDNETLYHNVVFMAGEEERSREKAAECLKCAQMWSDVQQMPEGLDTLIGQNGTTVSGGQRQRIALARALYKDFEILVMDEATAALDAETERAVIDSIRQLGKGKTLLMVTHHLNLAHECEYVYKLEKKQLTRIQ